MKKRLAFVLAIAMVVSLLGTFTVAFADESAIKESESGFYYVEETDTQAKVSAASKEVLFEQDGLWFKDLNKNGELDVYEDWRLPVEERVDDLLSQMTLMEKAGTLGFGGIGGKNGITVTNMSEDSLSTGQTGVSFISVDSEQMNNEEDVFVYVDETLYCSVAYQIKTMNMTTMIAAMTGTPYDQLNVLNKIQSIAEENRLGIPVVFSGDRSYNTWGGMVDMAHYAFGVAHDPELLYDLVSEYAKESAAIGYHQVFHGYGNEIGSFYGDDPTYIAEMAAIETRAYEDNGFNSHSKHFIARGGRNSYANAKSPANLIDSWMVGWQAVVDAGTQWVMTNNAEGVTGGGLQTYMDKATYSLLRDDLGYEGIICLDWPLGADSIMTKTGITPDGIDVSTLTLEERYALILDVGIDMFSCYGETLGTDPETDYTELGNNYYPEVVVAAVEDGLMTEEELDVHVGRILKNKFDIGIFEDPYSDWGEALELIGTDAYKEDYATVVPLSTEEIDNYRRPEIIEMEQQLMAESTILLKNDNNILPLAEGTKIYEDSNNESILTAEPEALAAYGEIVDSMEDADVCVFHVTSLDDAYELMIEDAQDLEKPIVVIFEGTNSSEPTQYSILSCDAFLMATYVNTPDHGSSIGSFYRYSTPSVVADILFGYTEAGGSTLFEVAYDSADEALSWGELQDDIGVDTYTRLYMAMLARNNPEIDMPNNLGDVLYTTNYGISYSNPSDIQFDLLTVPQEVGEVEVDMGSSVSTSTSVINATLTAGVPFEINFVAQNYGGDGSKTVTIYDNGEPAAEKFVALDEGQFRVFTVELTLEAGEHVIEVEGMSATVTVE